MNLMKVLLVLVVLFVGSGAVIGGCVYSGYNKAVGLDEQVTSSWAQVENQLQRRFDLIPNLVETVKGVAGQEKEIFLGIGWLRFNECDWIETTFPELVKFNDRLNANIKRGEEGDPLDLSLYTEGRHCVWCPGLLQCPAKKLVLSRMVEENVASAADIDAAMKLGYGHPMGPLELTDLVGLDIRLHIADYLAEAIGPRFRAPDVLRTKVAEGKLGKKSGEGFYRWVDGKRAD